MKRNVALLFVLFALLASGSTIKNLFGNPPPPETLIPQNLRVPALAFDEKSILLVWEKPANYSDVTDYNVYMSGKLLGSAKTNNALNSASYPYIEKFYENDSAGFHVRIQYHSFTVEKDADGKPLSPSTDYSFTVKSVLKDGSLSNDSIAVVQKTSVVPRTISITDSPYNAVGDGTLLSSVTDATNWDGVNVSAIQKGNDNTQAIQAAIDACPPGGKVVIPFNRSYRNNTYISGALYLKSNMTLEVQEGATLMGSVDAKKYLLSKGYRPNAASSENRPPSLLNTTSDYDGKRDKYANIRIVGKGVINGSGWASLDPLKDEAGKALSQYFASDSNSKGSASYNTGGLLAKSQMTLTAAGREETDERGNIRIWPAVTSSVDLSNAYSGIRSSLATFFNVNGLYISGITFKNPAFHGIMFIECMNATINGINVQTYDANNGDGIEFGKSENCLVFNSFLDTGDDCINFAASQGAAAVEDYPVNNVWIFNNYTREGHGGVVLGSNTGAWIQNILAEDNVMYNTDIALRCKSTPPTGGGGRNVIFRDTALKAIGGTSPQGEGNGVFVFTLKYNSGTNTFMDAPIPAQFRNFTIKNVTLDNVDPTFKEKRNNAQPIQIDGFKGGKATSTIYPEVFIENITFDNVKFTNVRTTSISRLKNGIFKDVVFTNFASVKAETNPTPWNITDSIGLVFTGSTSPLPPAGAQKK